jgi:N-acetylmuramoyl-L-alanine amidase
VHLRGAAAGYRHRNPGGPLRVILLVALALVVGHACKSARSTHSLRDAQADSPGEGVLSGKVAASEKQARLLLDPDSIMPSRADVVALSDELAIAAVRVSDLTSAVRLARLAADLRTRLWRVGRAETDAREALELYTTVMRQGLTRLPEEACEAALGRAAVSSEIARDPSLFYREAYVASGLFSATPCASKIAEHLRTLSGFRPSKDVLAELEKEGARRRGEAMRDQHAESAPARPGTTDDTGVVVAPPLQPHEREPVKVLSIQPYGGPDRARVVVTLSGPTTFEVGQALSESQSSSGDVSRRGKGPRLFVDLAHSRPSRRTEIPVGGLVERVREGTHGDAVRIVLDLTNAAYRRVYYVPEPFRVIIDVATHVSERSSSPPALGRGLARVALDPGHGGSDPGAVGSAGLREKDVVLDIAHRAAPILSRELGIVTLLTRDDDRLVPLDERTARANAFHADLFISIHCNAADVGVAHGMMSFVLDTTRDEVAARIAARENATSVDATSQVASMASNLRLADLASRSTRLAGLLQRTTMASLLPRFPDVSDQGVKTAGFFVLLGAEMPSVLFETSFISNPAEEKRLGAAEYRQKLADGIVNAVRAYREGR